MEIPLFSSNDVEIVKKKMKKKRKCVDADILSEVVERIKTDTPQVQEQGKSPPSQIKKTIDQKASAEGDNITNEIPEINIENSMQKVPLKLYVGGIGAKIKKCHLEVCCHSCHSCRSCHSFVHVVPYICL